MATFHGVAESDTTLNMHYRDIGLEKTPDVAINTWVHF